MMEDDLKRKMAVPPTRQKVEAYLDDLLVQVALCYNPKSVDEFGLMLTDIEKATGYKLPEYHLVYEEMKKDVQA